MTLGDKLQKAREKLGLSIPEAEEATKIRAKYLEAIEAGRYDMLPSGAYPRCFVFTYGNFLGLPETQLEVDWQKEANLAQPSPQISRTETVKLDRFLVTPKLFIVSGLAVIGLVVVSYLLYQVGRLTGGPDLIVDSPQDRTTVMTSSIAVSGHTNRGVSVLINGQAVTTDGSGHFAETIQLDPGLNTVEVSAKGDSGKQSKSLLLVERKQQISSRPIEPLQ